MNAVVAPDSRFWRWLKGFGPCEPPLAWCHVAEFQEFRAILESGSFLPQPCKVFKEDLLYCFYGRPAYRRGSNESIRIAARAPVVFVLNPAVSTIGKRAFPFDSGAYAGGRYARWFHERMGLDDFEMPCSELAPQRHVATFFGSNAAYMRLRPADLPRASYLGQLEVDCLVALMTDTDSATADDRKIAVELQVPVATPLDHHHVWAVIIPDELAEADYVREFLGGPGLGIEAVTYVMSPHKRAVEYQGLLEELALQIQSRRGLL